METNFFDLIAIQKREQEEQEKIIHTLLLSTYHQIDKALTDFTDNIQINVNKTRLKLSQAINGPPGASRQIQADAQQSIKAINREFDKLEIYLNDEIQKLKIAKNNVTNSLRSINEDLSTSKNSTIDCDK
ncbi:hypothetical protein Indivirus_2_7 [Indivirus ILV1]|uniref:Uncharacterized protein n=1 Tax=Indivirus ILV1 TaxID=1977633 RepID=A0A1V0SD96_9VIRU|nr:hypothetical protein Indivirus_2_7 [Indivirus ILV1]